MKKLATIMMSLVFIFSMAGMSYSHGKYNKGHQGHQHYNHHHQQVYTQPYRYHMRQLHRHFHGCGHAGYGYGVSYYNPYPFYGQPVYNQPGFSVYVGY